MLLNIQVTTPIDEFVDFIKNYPSGTPVIMLNILKFKKQTEDGKRVEGQAGKGVGQISSVEAVADVVKSFQSVVVN